MRQEKQIFLKSNDIVAISSPAHLEITVVIKNFIGKLVVTINDNQEKKEEQNKCTLILAF